MTYDQTAALDLISQMSEALRVMIIDFELETANLDIFSGNDLLSLMDIRDGAKSEVEYRRTMQDRCSRTQATIVNTRGERYNVAQYIAMNWLYGNVSDVSQAYSISPYLGGTCENTCVNGRAKVGIDFQYGDCEAHTYYWAILHAMREAGWSSSEICDFKRETLKVTHSTQGFLERMAFFQEYAYHVADELPCGANI